MMKFKIISPPYPPGERFFIPYGMGIVQNFLKNNHEIFQIDLQIEIRKHNKKGIDKINLNILNNQKKIEDFVYKDIKNPRFEKEIKKIIQLFNIKEDEIICFSVHCYLQLLYALLIAKLIKTEYNNKIVFGGSCFFNSESII